MRLWAAGMIITAGLARQYTIDATVGWMKPTVYTAHLIKICVCVICVLAYMQSQALDGSSV